MWAVGPSGRHSPSEPFMARPMGVRAVETMTASVMAGSSCGGSSTLGSVCYRAAPHARPGRPPAAEPGGVGVDAVEGLEPLPLGGVDAVEFGGELVPQRLGDVPVG